MTIIASLAATARLEIVRLSLQRVDSSPNA